MEERPTDISPAAETPTPRATSWRGIRKDLLHNIIFLAILLAGFIYDIADTYTLYIWFLLVPFLIYARLFTINKVSLATLIFGVAYVLPIMWQKEPLAPGLAATDIVYPLTFYYSGVYLCRRCKDGTSIIWILFLCILAYAAWPIVTNIGDFIETGEIVNLARGFDLDKKYVLATHQNMMMAMAVGGIGLVFVRPQTRMQRTFRVIAVVIGFLALFSALHILNRTSIVLAVISCVCGILWSGGGMKHFIYLIIVLAVITAIGYLAIMDTQWADLIEGFNSREQTTGYTVNSAGGRTIRWLRGMEAIYTYPWGSKGITVNFVHTFAHDFWLDIGVRAGWIPMLVMILITVWWFQSFIKFLKTPDVPRFYSGYVLMVLVTMLLQMAVEPVVEGQLPLLLLMYLNWGFMTHDYNLVYEAESQEPAPADSEESSE